MAFHHAAPLQHVASQRRESDSARQYTGPVSAINGLQALRNPYYNDANQNDLIVGHSNLVSPIMSRSPSVASNDRYSVVSGLTSTTYFPNTPQNVNPAPAYVAPFGAVQVVSEHQAGRGRRTGSDDEDVRPNKDDVQFSPPALTLVNAFLDQLLYSFLSTARSTSLAALRPAVTEVLKHRLAKDAIASAEEELQELLAGNEDEEEANTQQNSAENSRRWDLELVWKRTRLRVMVYMRLGELEDDDEERYVKEEELFHGSERRFSQSTGLVSWAAAIFLTSVLEYVAEQTLQVAGQAAYSRARRQSRSARLPTPADAHQPVVVDDYDVEKVALNSTLGRLWRTWRKALRNNAVAAPYPHHGSSSQSSRDNMHSALNGRPNSLGMAPDGSASEDSGQAHPRGLDDVPEMQFPEHVLASNIPLPMEDRRRDVDEIEVPGLANDPDAREEEDDKVPSVRRNSFTVARDYGMTGDSQAAQSTGPGEVKDARARPGVQRQRSNSVPAPVRAPLAFDLMRFITPGAYPQTPAVEEPPSIPEPVEEEFEPDHKFNAHEMASHKRSSMDVKQLLDKVVDHGPPEDVAQEGAESDVHGLRDADALPEESTPQEADSEHRDPVESSHDVTQLSDKIADPTPPEDNTSQETKVEHHGLIGGAIAGASAAAAATAAMVYGSSKHGDSLSHPVETKGEDLEETDKRKSLMNIKSFVAPADGDEKDDGHHSSQIMTARHASLSQPETPPLLVRTGSEESEHSYTLGEKDQQLPTKSPARRQHIANDSNAGDHEEGNGVATARSADFAPNTEELQARETTKPVRLILGGTPTRNGVVDSPIVKTGSPKSPHEFLQSRSLTSKTSRPDFQQPPSANDFSRPGPPPIKVPQKRRSIPGVAFTSAAQSPVVDKAPHRQSWGAALQQQKDQQDGTSRSGSVPNVPDVPTTHKPVVQPEPPVQEHPVVQRMASLKRPDRKADTNTDEPILTSASIRGPEDFDMFVQGADTVKYTLTPETVRDKPEQTQAPVELSSVPSVSKRRPSAPPIDTRDDTRTGRSSVTKQVTSATPEGTPTIDQAARRENRRSVSKPPPRNTSAHRRSGLIAREPQVMTESTRDFADFIRSTGPTKDQEVAPVMNLANRSTTSVHSLRSAYVNSASRASSVASQDRTRSMTKSVIEAENVPPVPRVPLKPKSGSMQPRGATGTGNGHADLIDFIRSGPDEQGQHRISRSVAPFRSTMDSDQLKDMGDRINRSKPLDLTLNTNVGNAPSQPSARSIVSNRNAPSQRDSMAPPVRTPTAPSHRTSVPTRSAILNNNPNSVSANVHPAHSGQPQRLSMGPTSLAPAVNPVRKRHRNKDPYAIDLDDEDDDDLLTALPKNKPRQEESLMDFLNNNEPPADNAPRPLSNSGGAQARNMMNRSRANSIRAQTPTGDASARTKSMQSPGGPRAGGAPSLRSMQSNHSNSGARLPRPGNSTENALPPVPKAKPQARGAGNASKNPAARSTGGTNDLADFLKNSGPEEDADSAPAPSVGRNSKLSPKAHQKAEAKVHKPKKGGLSGLFARATRRSSHLEM